MIVITGASSGIGEACARQLAKPGARLVLVARRLDRLQKLKSVLVAQGAEVWISEVDVKRKDGVSRWLEKSKDLLSQTRVLINNAGLARGLDPFQESSVEDLEEMILTNVTGLVMVTRGLIGAILRNRGHIVNIGSVAGRWAYSGGHVYCATKAAVRSLTESLRLDLLGSGVRVSEVAPGMVETEFSEVRLRDPEQAKLVYEGMVPLSAEDIAEAVSWILSRPSHVNIQEVVIYPTDQASVSAVHRNKAR